MIATLLDYHFFCMPGIEGFPRFNPKENVKHDQETLSNEYLYLQKKRLVVAKEASNLLRILDTARDEAVTSKQEIYRLQALYDQSYTEEKELSGRMNLLFLRMTEETKQKYLTLEN
jgi:hypothetical protein